MMKMPDCNCSPAFLTQNKSDGNPIRIPSLFIFAVTAYLTCVILLPLTMKARFANGNRQLSLTESV